MMRDTYFTDVISAICDLHLERQVEAWLDRVRPGAPTYYTALYEEGMARGMGAFLEQIKSGQLEAEIHG
jgi:hypothetical protein